MFSLPLPVPLQRYPESNGIASKDAPGKHTPGMTLSGCASIHVEKSFALSIQAYSMSTTEFVRQDLPRIKSIEQLDGRMPLAAGLRMMYTGTMQCKQDPVSHMNMLVSSNCVPHLVFAFRTLPRSLWLYVNTLRCCLIVHGQIWGLPQYESRPTEISSQMPVASRQSCVTVRGKLCRARPSL